MESAVDMLFDFEDPDEEPLTNCSSRGGLKFELDAIARRLELAARHPTELARQLHIDATTELQALREDNLNADPVRSLAVKLAGRGYDVRVRVALGGGPDCFKSLRHEFLIVRGTGDYSGMEFLVEPYLRQHFTIPHPSREYAVAVASTPEVFVGGSCRLVPIVQLLCALMADSFEQQGLALPPWRREAAMLSKWLPSPGRTLELRLPTGSDPTVWVPIKITDTASVSTTPVHCTNGFAYEPAAPATQSASTTCIAASIAPAATVRSSLGPCQFVSDAPTGPASPDPAVSVLRTALSPEVPVGTPAPADAAAAPAAFPKVAILGFAPQQSSASGSSPSGQGLYNKAHSDFDCGSSGLEHCSLGLSSYLASSGSREVRGDSLVLLEDTCAKVAAVRPVSLYGLPGCPAYTAAGEVCAGGGENGFVKLSYDSEDEMLDMTLCRCEGDAGVQEARNASRHRGVPRTTTTGMLPCAGTGAGLLSDKVLWGLPPDVPVSPAAQTPMNHGATAAAARPRPGVETLAPVHPLAPAIHLVRLGGVAWRRPQQSCEPSQQHSQLDGQRSWLPWLLPPQQKAEYQ